MNYLFTPRFWALACFAVLSIHMFTCLAPADDLRLRPISEKKGSEQPTRPASNEAIGSLVTSGRNTVLYVTSYSICRYDLVNQKIDIKGTTELLYCVARNPTNGVLATGGWSGVIRLWDPATLEATDEFKAFDTSIHAIAFSPDGDVIAAGGYGGAVKLWSNSKKKTLCTLEFDRQKNEVISVWSLAFSSDGKRLIAGSNGAAVWDLATEKMTALEDDSKGVVSTLALCAKEDKIVIGRGYGTVALFDAKSGRRDAVIQAFPRGQIGGGAATCLVVPDHSHFVIAGGGELRSPIALHDGFGEIRILDIDNMKVLHVYKTKSLVTTICLVDDGKKLVVGERNGTISVWEVVKE